MAPYDQFILFGDSLTQQSFSQERGFAFGAALQDAYVRRLDVINRGFSGYNSAQALRVLPEALPSPLQARVRFLTVFLGANDACLPESQSGQQIPLTNYRQNLVDILTHPSVKAHSPRIILITPPPVNEYLLEETDRRKGINEKRRTAAYTKKYADTARDVARALGVVVLDLWSAFMDDAGWHEPETLIGSTSGEPSARFAELMHDGLHFTPPAYELLFKELMRTIEGNWPDQMPDKLPLVFPAWGEAPRLISSSMAALLANREKMERDAMRS